jgi:predicted nuclease of predicted toxin-antitoxin system
VKILLDECLPADLRKHVVGHDCQTVPQAGLGGKANGELLALAERSGWQVLLTMDRGMPYQQNLAGRTISLAIIRAKSNRLPDLLPHVPAILAVLPSLKPGEVIPIG